MTICWFFAAYVIGFGLGLWGVLGLYFLFLKWRGEI